MQVKFHNICSIWSRWCIQLTNLSQLVSPHTLKINVSSSQQDLCYEQSAKVNLLINRHVQQPIYTVTMYAFICTSMNEKTGKTCKHRTIMLFKLTMIVKHQTCTWLQLCLHRLLSRASESHIITHAQVIQFVSVSTYMYMYMYMYVSLNVTAWS